MTAHKPNYNLQRQLQKLAQNLNIQRWVTQDVLDGIWLQDISSGTQWTSDKFWDVLGLSQAKELHTVDEYLEHIAPDDQFRARTFFNAERLQADQTDKDDFKFITQSGDTLFLACAIKRVKDAEHDRDYLIGWHKDVTLEKTPKSVIPVTESEYIFEMAPEAMLRVEKNGAISSANIKACDLFGYSKEEFAHLHIGSLVPNNKRANHQALVEQYFNEGVYRRMLSQDNQLSAQKKNGDLIKVEITLSLVKTAESERTIAIVRDMTERYAMLDSLKRQLEENKRLEGLALVDPLTGQYNQRYFDKAIKKSITDSLRSHTDLSLMILDLDHFKKINDTYGHNAGNAVLIGFADLVKQTIRYGDIFARVGGEEFAVILPFSDVNVAKVLAQRIVNKVAAFEFPITGGHLNVTVSIGVAQLNQTQDCQCQESLFDFADQALYKAKQNGRNRVETLS